MKRAAWGLLLAGSLLAAQSVPSNSSQETMSTDRDPDRSRPQPSKPRRPRRGLALVGTALAGTGAALIATAGRTRQAPASNCSFYPAPFVPCVAAHTVKTRSGVQEGIGGGLFVGGFVTLWVGLNAR